MENANVFKNCDKKIVIETNTQTKVIVGTQPIRIRAEQYNDLIELSKVTKRNISDLASLLIEFAIKYVEVSETSEVAEGNR